MKRITILILLALSISFVNAQKSEETMMLEKLNLKPIEFVINEQTGKRDKETNALRVNWNESFKSEAKEANATALFYLQEKREVYGLNSNLYDIKVVETIESPAGQYVYFQQYVNDIPVFATNFIIYINKENIITYVLNEFRNLAKYKEVKNKPSVNISEALKTVNEYLNITGDVIGKSKTELVYFESMDKGLELAWKINIIPVKPVGDWQIFVSASDGHIIHVEDIRMFVDGSGKVFRPNPLVSANVPYGYCCSANNCLIHNGGATNSCLDAQLVQVSLKDLTYENGLHKLKGPYCEVVPSTTFGLYPATIIPELQTSDFYFTRDQEQFGAVMCYYYVDLAARRILQLGYNVPDSLKNIKIDPHGIYGPGGTYYYSVNQIAMGTQWFHGNTFVPACEDADVILHEYAHAIQWTFIPTGMSYSNETSAVQEGCSDYWATSFKRHLYPNYWQALAVWMDMDVLFCARRTDLNWVYYPNVYGHNGGQIWSSALMKIWGDLGRDITDQLFLESHLIWGYSPTMRDAATAFMKADLNLYKGAHLCQIHARFQEHGLIDTNEIIKTTSFTNQTVTTNKIVFSCSDLDVQDVNVTNGATLELDAVGRTRINSIKVELGSGLRIE